MNNNTLTGKRYFPLDDNQRIHWLRLIRSQNVGPATFRDLISHFGTAEQALEALPDLAKRGGAAARIRICPVADAEKELSRARACGARMIGIGEPDYPMALRLSEAAPPVVFIRGNSETLGRNSIGMVGSRNASISGMKFAGRLATELGQAGYTIVSGLARGIDTSVHKASLREGTTAVFAGGVDHVFPEENQDLATEILENNGVIISEMPMGWQPRAKDFPRRNRIIAGLSMAVVVVEAAKRSGSLITARMATETGRLVLAVPGSPLDPRSDGTNQLIRNGATLITSSADVLEAVSPLTLQDDDDGGTLFEPDFDESNELSIPPQELSEDVRLRILNLLGPSPIHIDDVIRFSGARAGEVQLALVELDLAGQLERHPGGLVSRIEPISHSKTSSTTVSQ